MENWKSHFCFNRQERSGIFYLLLLILFVQLAYFLLDSYLWENKDSNFKVDLELEKKISAVEARKDSLYLYPFNPNYMTEFKGYVLGIKARELDRLYQFREQGNFMRSLEEFQLVTGVSDSLLAFMAPYFRFPEPGIQSKWRSSTGHKQGIGTGGTAGANLAVKDLNMATAEELQSIRGIGPVLSKRIIRFRNALGGFLSGDQLLDVYGLDTTVVELALKRFDVLQVPVVEKIDLNSASVVEIGRILYISQELAEEIVRYRETVGKIVSFDEIAQIEGFPSEKIDRIKLYLSL